MKKEKTTKATQGTKPRKKELSIEGRLHEFMKRSSFIELDMTNTAVNTDCDLDS
jgi:hypothetical protein